MKIPVPWIFVLGYLIGIPVQIFFNLKFKSPVIVKIYLITGIILFIIAAIIASWSLVIFHKAHTTTTPGMKSAKLIMKGPYQFSRNPMYISLILAYIGEAAILNHICPLFVLPILFCYVNNIIIKVEEDFLTKEFNADYLNYKKKVPRWL